MGGTHLPNPRDSFELRHREGDVVEVELVDYVNWYIARVLMPDGELVEMRTNDIHAGPRRAGESSRPLRSGERIHVVFRCAHLNRLWMDRYPERDQEYACDAAGYRNARVAGERTSAAQRRFIARRNTPRGGDAGPEGD